MRTTMDKAGRVVIPRELRERLGLSAGPVDLEIDGSGLHVSAVITDDDPLVERDGRLIIAPGGATLTDDDVRVLRDADRR